jgi:hypothetical protein
MSQFLVLMLNTQTFPGQTGEIELLPRIENSRVVRGTVEARLLLPPLRAFLRGMEKKSRLRRRGEKRRLGEAHGERETQQEKNDA